MRNLNYEIAYCHLLYKKCFQQLQMYCYPLENIKILKELEGWFKYELPENLIGIIWKGKYRGQKQKWYVVRFIGKTSEINLKTKNPEFIEWKWVQKEKLPKIIVDFKKHVYERLLIELKKII